MDLARLTVNLRPRNPWEGIDLGFALARRWFPALWLLWMVGALPLFLLLNLLLPIPSWLAGLLAWWCKPLYEPPLLFWLGRVVFGERPGVREMRSSWPRILWPQLLANLTWRRFSASRSFVMPVAVLEGLQGKARRSRIRVLSRQQHGAGWLTLVGINFELILELGLLILLVMLLPEELQWIDLESFLFDPQSWQQGLQQLTALLAMSVIAPFYVAAGFGLYLTRRSQLEAWDVELGLRGMAERMRGKRLVAGLLLCLPIGLSVITPAGQTLQAAELSREQAASLIQSVMADDDFGERETHSYWKYTGESEETGADLSWLIEIFEGFTQGFAAVAEVVIWLALGALVVYLIYWFLHHPGLLERMAERAGGEQPLPVIVAGLDIRPDSLPGDIAGTAAGLIKQGQPRPALSLLYRGAISALVYRHQLRIAGSATEGECLDLAREVLQRDEYAYLRRLTGIWQGAAYGHQLPDRQAAEQLCRGWMTVYGESGGE
ncbi:MAG: DUF4129 domain-containing protein [Pseudomonadota bacterium]